MAMTRDCFEPGPALCGRGGLAIASGDGFAAVAPVCAGRGERFFAVFDIEILRFVMAASRRTTEAPPRLYSRRGRISERPWGARNGQQYRSNRG